MAIDEVLKLDQGECVFINPAYRGQGEASVPLKLKLKVPVGEVKIQAASEKLWEALAQRLALRMAKQQIAQTDLDQESQIRQALAEKSFPLNPTEKVTPNTLPTTEATTANQNTDDDFDASEYMMNASDDFQVR